MTLRPPTGQKAARVRDYIEHILASIGRIEAYVHDLNFPGSNRTRSFRTR
jgi:uncharacterized protein with HEPN domain